MRLILLILILLISCERPAYNPPSARPVKAVQVRESSKAEQSIIFPGILRAVKRADLSFRLDGTVLLRKISVGYEAKNDEILMQLDPREYEIALAKAKGRVASIQAQLDFAGRDFIRMKNIYERDSGAISLSLVDKKKETINQLNAELSIAEGDLDKATDDLSYTSLRAPFEGIVVAIYVENHEQIRAKQSVLRILDTAFREMEINVPVKFINAIIAGREKLHFTVTLDAFPDKKIAASIREIGTEASGTSMTYPVTLSLSDVPLELRLLAGMSGTATLKQSKESEMDTLQIPKSALFGGNGNEAFVWVVDRQTQTVHKKAVSVETSHREESLVVHRGLQASDWVVTAGTSFLSEGQQVKVVPEPLKP